MQHSVDASTRRLMAIATGMVSVQFAWAVQTAWATSLFVLRYGVREASVSTIRLAGPLAGLIVQPAAGALSDRRGSRRAFFGAGVLLMCAGLLVLPNASFLLGRGVALPLAVAALWALDIGLNLTLVSLRAMAADACAAEHQANAQAALASADGLGQLVGYLASSQQLARACGLPAALDLSFLFGAGVLVLCAGGASVALAGSHGRSTPATPAAPVAHAERRTAHVLRAFAVWRLPRWMRAVCCSTFCAWLGWFACILFASHWVGADVFGGDGASSDTAEREAYARGVHFAALGLTLQAALTALTGAGPLQLVIRAAGLRQTFAAALVLQGVLTCATCAVPRLPARASHAAALALIGALGPAWAATQTVPYLVVAQHAPRSELGLLMGKLNIFVVAAEVCTSLACSALFGARPRSDVCRALAGGGLCALVGVLATPFIPSAPESHRMASALPLGHGAGDRREERDGMATGGEGSRLDDALDTRLIAHDAAVGHGDREDDEGVCSSVAE